MCKNYREKGVCKYGDKCLFAHGDHELTRRGSPTEKEQKPNSTESKNKDEAAKESESKNESKGENTTLDTTKLESSQNQTVIANKSKVEEEIETGKPSELRLVNNQSFMLEPTPKA